MTQEWRVDLENAFQAKSQWTLSDLETANQKFKQAEAQIAPFRRKSRMITAIEKFLIRVVSAFYFVESGIRKLLRRPFRSEFLVEFQELTKAAFELVLQKFGEIQIPLPLPMNQADGTGGLTVGMLLSSASCDEVASLLPRGLELMPRGSLLGLQDRIPPGQHPIMIGLGFNHDVGPVKKDRTFVKMRYLELTVGIPAVQLAEDFGEPRGPFFYLPALYLDALTPTLLGWAYGFRKRLKRFSTERRTYSVRSFLFNRPVFAADVVETAPGSELRFAADIPDLAPWLAFLDQPIITKTWWGKFRCTFFHWDWFYTPALAARVDMTAFTDKIPLIHPGKHQFSAVAKESPRLAYLMSVPWRLVIPFDRKVLSWRSAFKYVWPFRKNPAPAAGKA